MIGDAETVQVARIVSIRPAIARDADGRLLEADGVSFEGEKQGMEAMRVARRDATLYPLKF